MQKLKLVMTEPATVPTLMALSKWCREAGINPVTAWRWRKLGWLKTTNIAGRVYVSGDALREFQERADRGDFAQTHVVPSKGKIHAHAE